jgi:hypothetical protein
MLEVLAQVYADEVEQAKQEVFEWVAEQTGTSPQEVEKAWRRVMITYQGAKMLGGPSQKLAQTLLKSDAGKKVTGFLRNLKPTRSRVPAKTQPRQIGFTDPQGVAHTQHLKPGKMEVLPGNDSKKVRVQTERRPGAQKASQPSKPSPSGASDKTLREWNNGSLVKGTVKTQKDIPASSLNAKEALRKKMSLLQNAQKNSSKVRHLPDGRTRFYRAERPSNKSGNTRGASFVVEHNPKTGQVKAWNEC